VVAVRVREQHRLDGRLRARAEELLELAEEAPQAGVDDHEPLAVLDHVEVHQLVAQPVDAGRHLGRHRRELSTGIRKYARFRRPPITAWNHPMTGHVPRHTSGSSCGPRRRRRPPATARTSEHRY
jgi:hypothetical protein